MSPLTSGDPHTLPQLTHPCSRLLLEKEPAPGLISNGSRLGFRVCFCLDVTPALHQLNPFFAESLPAFLSCMEEPGVYFESLFQGHHR